MAKAEDHRRLSSKHKAITALLPYAIWRERDGQPKMFDTILYVTRASRMSVFMWRHINKFVRTLFSESSPRAIVLASPHTYCRYGGGGGLVRYWIAAASAVPYSEEIAQAIVDTLLQIASRGELQHVPVDLWSWLTKRPSLPPICEGRSLGTCGPVVEAVLMLKDIEILKSYLFVVWSEWDTLDPGGFGEIRTLIREVFGGIKMRHHRTDLIQRLDHVLVQLDRGSEYIQPYKPWFDEGKLQLGKNQYRKLRETLLEMNSRKPFTDYASPYTDSYPGCTQNPVRRLCVHSLPRVHSVHSVAARTLNPPIPYFVCTSASTQSARFVTSPDALLILPELSHVVLGCVF